MKIVRIDAFTVAIERDDPLAGGAGVSTRAGHGAAARPRETRYARIGHYRAVFPRRVETMMVRIETDTGTVGYGEAQAPVLPEIPSLIINELFRDLLVGQDPSEIDMLWQVMYDAMRERGHYTGFLLDAISAIDIALWDIAGKARDLPVAHLLADTVRSAVPVYFSGLSAPTLAAQVDVAKRQRDLGFTAFKVFLGFDPATDVESVRTLRDALADTRLMVDAHWMYSLPQAITAAAQYESLDVAWLESPLVPEDLIAHAELARNTSIPIAIGEGERSVHQFEAILERQAASILQPDVGRAGGITGCRRIARLAASHGITVAPHCGVGLAAYIAASAHLAAALPNLELLEYQPTMHQVSNHFLRDPLQMIDGHLVLPERPGLGIAFDDTALQRHVVA